MKKRGSKRKRVRKGQRRVAKYDIKKTLAFKFLIASIIILILLIVLWVFVYKPAVKEEGYGLGTLKWDWGGEDAVFEVLDYSIDPIDNLTAYVNINWTSGDKDVNQILIDFIGAGTYCNDTRLNDLSLGENKTYWLDITIINCDEATFENVTDVQVYAQVHINLTRTSQIANIMIYNDDSLINVVDLDNYFSALVNISYSIVGDSENKTGISINDTTNFVSFDPKLNRYGNYEFNLTAESEDGDVLNVNNYGDNMTFYVFFINDDRPIANSAPTFNNTECDNLIWNKNTSYTLNMTKCWSDEDGDSISGYRYENKTNGNLTISLSHSGIVLTLTPNTNWIGSRYFFIYATDGTEENGGRVDFTVTGSGTTSQITSPSNNVTNPNIKTASPTPGNVTLTNTSKVFTITAEKYVSIKWYLNGAVIPGTTLSHSFDNLKNGDIIKVEAINGSRINSKTWEIIIGGDETPSAGIGINFGTVVFYSIIVMIVIVILLIIWVFISNKNQKSELARGGFGVTGGPRRIGRDTRSNSFTFPSR